MCLLTRVNVKHKLPDLLTFIKAKACQKSGHKTFLIGIFECKRKDYKIF